MSETRGVCRLAYGLAERLAAHAEAAYPKECCGLLLGQCAGGAFDVDAYAQSPNLAADPARAFEIDPALRLRLQRELRGTGRAVIGVFHSHPAGPAEPSAADRTRAVEPDFLWLISGRGGGLAAFWAPAAPGMPFRPLSLHRGDFGGFPSPRD